MQRQIDGWRYPFDLQDRAFLFSQGGRKPLIEPDFDGRHPVLAIGSNGAPSQLRRKFGERADIPVTEMLLEGWAVVYSAHVSGYGAIPATMIAREGAQSLVFVTWLTPTQLHIMDRSEGVGVNYERIMIRQDDLDLLAYVSIAGAFGHDDQPIRVAEVATSGDPAPRLGQGAMLDYIARIVGFSGSGRDFSAKAGSDKNYRIAINRKIKGHAL